jgi:hypothetical protein
MQSLPLVHCSERAHVEPVATSAIRQRPDLAAEGRREVTHYGPVPLGERDERPGQPRIRAVAKEESVNSAPRCEFGPKGQEGHDEVEARVPNRGRGGIVPAIVIEPHSGFVVHNRGRVEDETPTQRAGAETGGYFPVHLRSCTSQALRKRQRLASEHHVCSLEEVDISRWPLAEVVIPNQPSPPSHATDVIRERSGLSRPGDHVPAAGAAHRWIFKMFDNAAEPIGTRTRIVIEKGENLTRGGLSSSSHGRENSRPVHEDFADSRSPLEHFRTAGIIAAANHKDFISRTLLSRQPAETSREMVRAQIRRHDHGNNHGVTPGWLRGTTAR